MPWRTFIPALVVAAAFLQPVTAQAPPAPRITQAVTDRQMVRLQGNTNPLARPAADRGAAAPERALDHMLLVLRRSDRQQADLRQLLDELRENDAPQYHQWLTPQEFGARFGPAPADVATITAWLAGEGFRIDQVAAGGGTIEFSGTAANVAAAFHTQMHRYQVNGVMHLANAGDPAIPAALAPIIAGVASLNDFQSHPDSHIVAQGHFVAGPPGAARPALNYTDQNSVVQHALVPGDLGKIYDLGANPATGSGETIALVARSDVNPTDVSEFRSLFGAGIEGQFQTIQVAADPGIASGQNAGDAGEATLDAEWANALAPAANVDLVVAASTDTTDGVDLAAQYIVDHDLAPVMSTSFGLCEASEGAAENTFWSNLWEQASAEGITALVSSGDDGAAGCDDQAAGTVASQGLAVSGVASTPYDTAVGGTEFNESSGPGSYWSATNGAGYVSALGYIPEAVWNESSAASGNVSLWAGSGGKSVVYAKPAWQAGAGVPADNARDLPDVALTAASHDGYVVCINNSCNEVNGGFGFGVDAGTSAASPSWAGIMALVDQQQDGPVGLANPVLYKLATAAAVFHDVTTGSNAVPCAAGTPDCGASGTLGYNAGLGFDLATGWGSPNIASLLQQWGTVKFAASTTTLQLTLPQNLTYGQSVPVAIQVTPANSGPTPTGEVVLLAVQPDTSEAEIANFPLDENGDVTAPALVLPAGSYSVVARYSGDLNYGTSASKPMPATVAKDTVALQVQFCAADATGNCAPIAQANYGDAVEAQVTLGPPAGVPAPTGTITTSLAPFQSQSATLDASGGAVFKIFQPLDPGSYAFTVSYPGDANYEPANTAATLTVVQTPTTLKIVSITANNVVNVELDTASRGGYVGSASVQVMVNGALVAEGTAWKTTPDPVTGNADITFYAGFLNPLPGTSLTYVAQFAATKDYMASTSPSFAGPTPPNPSFSPSSLDFGVVAQGASSTKASVLTNHGGLAMPVALFGTSDFTETNDCGSTLASGANCVVQVTFHPNLFTVAYSRQLYPDADSGSRGQSWGAPLSLTGSAPGFTLKAPSNSAPFGVGTPAVFQLQLTPINGAIGAVGLSCSQVPPLTSCSFSPAAPVLDGTDSVNLTLTVTETPVAQSFLAPPPGQPWFPSWLALLGFAGAIMVIGGLAVRNRRLELLVAGVVLLAACGGGGSPAVTSPPPSTGGTSAGGGADTNPPPSKAQMQVTPTAIDFGTVAVGQPAIENVTVSNSGNATLSDIYYGFQESANDFGFTNQCGTTLAPGAQCQIAVHFNPQTTVKETGTLFVNSSASSQQVSLSASGLLTKLPSGSYGVSVSAKLGNAPQSIGLDLNVP